MHCLGEMLELYDLEIWDLRPPAHESCTSISLTCHAMSCRAAPFHGTPYNKLPCHAVPCYAKLCYVVPQSTDTDTNTDLDADITLLYYCDVKSCFSPSFAIHNHHLTSGHLTPRLAAPEAAPE